MNKIIVRNIPEYIDAIKNAKEKNQIWFRGMSKANRYLEPSLFREKRLIGLRYSGKEINGRRYRKSDAVIKSDYGVLNKFKKKYDLHFPQESKNFNLIDYLYVMQHYDIPTRLLDFSRNELIALYFSVSKEIKSNESTNEQILDFTSNNGISDKGSSIHCINPNLTNKNTYGDEFVVNIDDVNDINSLYRHDLPICIETNNSIKRIKAQEGVFMFFGNDYRKYEDYDIFKTEITKIFIPNACRNKIKKELKTKYNIHHSNVYPDLKGIALEITEDIEDKYIKDCESVFGKNIC